MWHLNIRKSIHRLLQVQSYGKKRREKPLLCLTQTAQNGHSWLLVHRVMSLAQQSLTERKQQLWKKLILHLTFTTGTFIQFTLSKTLRFGEVPTISASPYEFNETFFSFS